MSGQRQESIAGDTGMDMESEISLEIGHIFFLIFFILFLYFTLLCALQDGIIYVTYERMNGN